VRHFQWIESATLRMDGAVILKTAHR